MAFTANFGATAQRLINSAGSDCVLKKVTQGVYDLETDTVTSNEASTSVKAWPHKLTWSEQQDPTFSGLKVAAFLIAGADLASPPEVGDYFQDSGDDYLIKKVKPYEYKGSTAMWRVLGVQG